LVRKNTANYVKNSTNTAIRDHILSKLGGSNKAASKLQIHINKVLAMTNRSTKYLKIFGKDPGNQLAQGHLQEINNCFEKFCKKN
jgi:hypothetical protein